MWLALLRAILIVALGGLSIVFAISDLIIGHSTGKYGEDYTRGDSPGNSWFNTEFHLLIGIAVTVALARAFFLARGNSSDDDQ
jgi:hypothetical protein